MLLQGYLLHWGRGHETLIIFVAIFPAVDGLAEFYAVNTDVKPVISRKDLV